uniref:Uncharacterized protein n=1 Tax=Hanusia phi TaxID=3032 RepID=A0A7S0EE47_9CRYP|mmetsp:Transcript_21554/g.48832  ORF Transcript_21554/g.48832 Transcript_21554/m.48832 type:complete len:298 (+) Transcript_21554:115-1008(+)
MGSNAEHEESKSEEPEISEVSSSAEHSDSVTKSWVDDAFLPTSNVADLNFDVCHETLSQIGNTGAGLVGQKLLSGFPWITTLWLENNNISHEGVSLLAGGFEQHASLTDLSLASNPIRKEGLQLTIESFLRNPKCSISRLNVRNCQINILPLEISELESLKELLCEDNPIRSPPKDIAFRRLAILRQFLRQAKNETSDEGVRPLTSQPRDRGTNVSVLGSHLPPETETVKHEDSFASSGWNKSTSSYDAHTQFAHGNIWYSKAPTIDPVSLVRKQNIIAQDEEFRIKPNITLRYTDD